MTKSSLASFQKDILTKSLLYGTDTRLGGGGGGEGGLSWRMGPDGIKGRFEKGGMKFRLGLIL